MNMPSVPHQVAAEVGIMGLFKIWDYGYFYDSSNVTLNLLNVDGNTMSDGWTASLSNRSLIEFEGKMLI